MGKQIRLLLLMAVCGLFVGNLNGGERNFSAKITNALPIDVKAKIDCAGIAKDKGYETVLSQGSTVLRCLRGTGSNGIHIKYADPVTKKEKILDLDWKWEKDQVDVMLTVVPTWKIEKSSDPFNQSVKYTLSGFKVAAGFNMDVDATVIPYSSACPACPKVSKCPPCPKVTCPPCVQKPCPTCPKCPVCPTVKPCPKCPTCPKCPEAKLCPVCPKCAEVKACPVCPKCPPCTEKACPACQPTECPKAAPCPDTSLLDNQIKDLQDQNAKLQEENDKLKKPKPDKNLGILQQIKEQQN